MLDTNVLLRAGLLQFLVAVASTGAYLPRWSAAIQAEWSSQLGRRPEDLHERLRACLDTVPDALLPVADRDRRLAAGNCHREDEHVLATALCARRLAGEDPDRWGDDCDVVLVTGNERHFPADRSEPLGVKILSPDKLGERLLADRPQAVLRTIQREPRSRYAGYLERMRRDGMKSTADAIDRRFAELALPD